MISEGRTKRAFIAFQNGAGQPELMLGLDHSLKRFIKSIITNQVITLGGKVKLDGFYKSVDSSFGRFDELFDTFRYHVGVAFKDMFLQ